ncbi:MAG: YafY family transcriptional regulator [Spirochaetales bacterium]|nr:YafY family transcriptional regulator [Spirochaetales bacterium]
MKIDRMLAMILILLTRKRVTASELADYFEVSVRTIYRDIESLSMTGIPVYAEQGRGGGISLVSEFRLEERFFLKSELNDLIAAVQEIPKITGDANLENAVEKMRFLSGVEDAEKSGEPVVSCDFTGSLRPQEKEMMARLSGAIRSQHQVEFSYQASEQPKRLRQVEPLRLIFLHRSWYLQAWCLLRGDYRLFKIARISDLRVLSEHFDRTRRMKDLPEASIRNSKPPVSLELLFTPAGAEGVGEYFNESDFRQTEEGLIINIEWPLDEWVYRFLMGFGPELTVLGPPAVRDEIARRHREAAVNYFLNSGKT